MIFTKRLSPSNKDEKIFNSLIVDLIIESYIFFAFLPLVITEGNKIYHHLTCAIQYQHL